MNTYKIESNISKMPLFFRSESQDMALDILDGFFYLNGVTTCTLYVATSCGYIRVLTKEI